MKIDKKFKIPLIILLFLVIVGLPIIGYLNFIGYSFRHHKILTKDELLQIFTQDEFEFQVYVIESYNQENHGFKFYELDKNLTMNEMVREINNIFEKHSQDKTMDLFDEIKAQYNMKDITQEVVNINEKIPYYKEDAQIIADYNKESHGNWLYTGFSKINYPIGKAIVTNRDIYPSNAFEIKECRISTSLFNRLLGKSKYCVYKKKIHMRKYIVMYDISRPTGTFDDDKKGIDNYLKGIKSNKCCNNITDTEISIKNNGISYVNWLWQ